MLVPHLHTFIIIGIVLSLLSLPVSFNVWAAELDTLDDVIDNFTTNLETEIYDTVSSALNNTSNTTSTQIVASNVLNSNCNNALSGKTVTTTGISNDNTSIGVTASMNMNINSNGVCINTLVGGDSNDILSC